ncbi:hypothetical protein HNR40_007149 [Nonomuraea endophytica]|uniref:Uncharacterized protein n=1 Tax=Nonomuraea endophytica TaxID=714136 RepID=A0A7W8EJH0_9ACTN|nr:hypothetical protein [Nonomuraea endophytica]
MRQPSPGDHPPAPPPGSEHTKDISVNVRTRPSFTALPTDGSSRQKPTRVNSRPTLEMVQISTVDRMNPQATQVLARLSGLRSTALTLHGQSLSGNSHRNMAGTQRNGMTAVRCRPPAGERSPTLLPHRITPTFTIARKRAPGDRHHESPPPTPLHPGRQNHRPKARHTNADASRRERRHEGQPVYGKTAISPRDAAARQQRDTDGPAAGAAILDARRRRPVYTRDGGRRQGGHTERGSRSR